MSEVEKLSAVELRRLKRALEVIIEELGTQTTLRQVISLITIALSNQAGKVVGVRDLDRALGDLSPGSASKLLKPMMHVETARKAGIANTVIAERDPNDLRSWNLHLTPKAVDALEEVLDAMHGR